MQGFVPIYQFGEFELRPGERALTCGGQPTSLGARAYDLLSYLIEHRDPGVSKEEHLDHVWPGIAVEEANLTVRVSALRKALGAQVLSTVTGRGYRFVMPVSDRLPKPSTAPIALTPPSIAGGR